MGTYVLIALITAVLMQYATALGIYLSSTAVLENTIRLGTLSKMAFVYLPAIFCMIGLATLLVGAFPKVTPIIWAYVLFVILVLYLGGILDFPDWLNNLSVFHHTPEYPYEEMNWTTMGIITAISLGLTILGFVGYNKRDIKN